ncbi:MAG: hypothetical protein J2P23_13450 [Microlunatus sp.]|nr:hypothetical protein [Microlunatus sp.]
MVADPMPTGLQRTLYASFGTPAEVDRLFQQVPPAAMDRLILAPTDWAAGARPEFWRGQVPGTVARWASYPFGAAAVPELAARRDPDQVATQLAVTDRVYDACLARRTGFFFTLVVPKFPFNDPAAVRVALPGLFGSDGRIDLTAAQVRSTLDRILDAVLDDVRERYPGLAGFMISAAEGAGATVHEFRREDFEELGSWLDPLLTHVAEYGERHGLRMIILAHHYTQTRATRDHLHRLLGRHPGLEVLEDLTWPEEHLGLPWFGYLGDVGPTALATTNRLHVKFLLDTEYMGQGRIPSVLPNWIADGIRAVAATPAAGILGRVNYWDGRATFDGWNALNVELFCALGQDPGADPEQLLQAAVVRRFGDRAAGLADLLLDGEELLGAGQAINGIAFTDHSAFPPPEHLHHSFFRTPLHMKATDDLFATPGTALYGPATGSITATTEWRQQLRTVTRSPADYDADLDLAGQAVARLALRAADLTDHLAPRDRDFVQRSYAMWRDRTTAHRVYAAAAADHTSWFGGDRQRAGSLRRHAVALEQLAEDFERRNGCHALFEFVDRLRSMADYLRHPGYPAHPSAL